jgi:Alpha/beta hydrolase family
MPYASRSERNAAVPRWSRLGRGAPAWKTECTATFVLIPGAGTDPRVYASTIEALDELGHDGLAPALPLHDQDAGPSDHADAVAESVPRDAPVVVAQSLGAFAGPLVAARVPVARLVLLAPMIPKPGETAGEWWSNTRHDQAIADLLARHGPMSSWGPDALAEVFLHDVDPLVAAENERFQGAPGRGMFTEPWPLEGWPDVPTTVLAPTGDRLFPPDFQRRVARERLGLEIHEMPGGHLPMLSRPRELAERLVELTG